jgi:hypothetical protein
MRELIAFAIVTAMPTAAILFACTLPPRGWPKRPMRARTGVWFAAWFLLVELYASLSFLGPPEKRWFFVVYDVVVDRWHLGSSDSAWPFWLNIVTYVAAGFFVGTVVGSWMDARRRPR